MIKTLLLGILMWVALPTSILAKDPPPRPAKQVLVNDYAGIFSRDQISALEEKLVAFDDSTSNQIVVVTEESLEGDDAASYAAKLGEAWGVGRAKENNGVVVYIAVNDRKYAIQIGYGLEPVITDAHASKIGRDIIVPAFKQGLYFEGIDLAVNRLMVLATNEYSRNAYIKDGESQPGEVSFGTFLFLMVGFLVIMYILSRRSRRSGFGSFTGGRGPFIFGSGSGWGGGSGGGGGGGFGGFGGGGFGGGGSSGSW